MDNGNVKHDIHACIDILKKLNPIMTGRRSDDTCQTIQKRNYTLQKVLVANRGEIAKRFFLALHEESIPSVAVVTDVDKGQTWYEFADEVIYIGHHENYSHINIIVAAILFSKSNAVYTGYGFLSENPDFVETVDAASKIFDTPIVFMGPHHGAMRMVGNKINARALARDKIPLFKSSPPMNGNDLDAAVREAEKIGFPLMLKLSVGGGGKGMQVVQNKRELADGVLSAVRIGKELYNDSTFYLEEYIKRPVHMEVQIFNGSAIGIRKCAVQRRNQKIIEESGHNFIDQKMYQTLVSSAEKMADLSGYSRGCGAGTVEFLIDSDTGRVGFIEVNTRLQVEYAVTDQSLGIDLAKWQILFFDGRGHEIIGLDPSHKPRGEGDHSIECRIYAEEPENNYMPSPGTIQILDLPTFNGIRCDLGFSEGDRVLPVYDPMIGKIIAHGSNRNEALIRMERALQEFYIKGVKTNVNQLLRIIRHPAFIDGNYTNNLLIENEELSFNVAESGFSDSYDRRGKKHIIFGAFTEYIHFIQRSVREFIVAANIESIIDLPVISPVPSKFNLQFDEENYSVEFLQTGIDSFLTYLNGAYNGRLVMVSVNDRSDDFLLVFGSSSFRVRVNRYIDHIDIRMRDEFNKVKYYRVSIQQRGLDVNDRIQTVRSPFQGTFVTFSNENIYTGAPVTKGDPLIVLSSMKMETVIYAPCDGKIIELIDDGNLSQLILSQTPRGKLIGRSIQANEVLVKIEAEDLSDSFSLEDKKAKLPDTFYNKPGTPFETILTDGFEDNILKNINSSIECLFDLLYAVTRGFIYQPGIVDKIIRVIRRIIDSNEEFILPEDVIKKAVSILYHYTGIKKLFSPVLTGEGLSFPQELSQYIQNKEGYEKEFSRAFLDNLERLFTIYGLDKWEGRPEVKKMLLQYLFVLFKRSYQFCLDHIEVVQLLVRFISIKSSPEAEILEVFEAVLEHEQSEKDDSLLKFIKNILYSDSAVSEQPGLNQDGSEDPGKAAGFSGVLTHGIRSDSDLLFKSLKEKEKDLIPPSIPAGFKEEISTRMSLLAKDAPCRLYSPINNIYIYSIQKQPSMNYCVLVCAEIETALDIENQIYLLIEEAAVIIQGYHDCEPGLNHWIEVIIRGISVSWSQEHLYDGAIYYENLRHIGDVLGDCFKTYNISHVYLTLPACLYSGEQGPPVTVSYNLSHGGVDINLLHDDDNRNPYFALKQIHRKNQNLYNIDKWPIENWALRCFDHDSSKEIIIPSIDGKESSTKVSLMTGMRPVAGKIFFGSILGEKACFYMKDSRISGGSTGSREGLKYIAAVYLSYLNDCPLYVWNDSAGANIGEGIVSLNRGAEGFMMNALAVQNVGSKKFNNYIRNVEDPELRELFQELHAQFSLSYEHLDKKHNRFFLVAVGIGSSAGLDVYGSSQATIQVLLDSPQSYRVLTGSNVVRTVMGEDISNYDIGGAKILGKWTGIVDLVAQDKLHLLQIINSIQSYFASNTDCGPINRPAGSESVIDKKYDDIIVFKESTVRDNVDDGMFWSFKKDFYASEALIGGFAKLGGRRALVMGPRTHFGLRSIASIIRACELIKLAQRTSSPQILVYGKKWHQSPDYHENISMQSRLDFLKALWKKSGVRIHIITHVDGLKCADINTGADAVIYLSNTKESGVDLSFISQNSSFIVYSFEEAFDLSHRLIDLIDPVDKRKEFEVSHPVPSMPPDPAEPYDMVKSIIVPVFDKRSFLEFYCDMNDPVTGPNLITGLARLEGRTVGVIADQPLSKGGGADAHGTEKFRVFTEFLNVNAIPLVMFSNSSGFVPGSQQERYRIQAIGAESLDANILGEIPVVSVVLNQNYGGRLIHAFNKFLRPGIVYLAYAKALMGVIGVDAAFELLFGKKYSRLVDQGRREDAERLRTEFMESYTHRARASNDAMGSGLVDWLIYDIADLRQHLVRGLDLAFQRCREAFDSVWDDI